MENNQVKHLDIELLHHEAFAAIQGAINHHLIQKHRPSASSHACG